MKIGASLSQMSHLPAWFCAALVGLALLSPPLSAGPLLEGELEPARPLLALKKKVRRGAASKEQARPESPPESTGETPPEGTTDSPVATANASRLSKAHPRSNVEPHFSVYFDLLLVYQPGRAEFSFVNFHPLLLFEIIPSSEIQFSFEVNPSPRYYELDWTLSSAVQLRLGKFWIPFDDMNPHNFFGGVVGTSRMRLGSEAFLPDIWADLGVGAKFTLVDSSSFLLEGHAYVINGFQADNAADPLGVSSNYPSFSDSSISNPDNNNDKGIGLRMHMWIENTIGLGVSVFRCRWTPQTEGERAVIMYGADMQLRFAKTEFKLGGVAMNAQLLDNSFFDRVGAYAELSQKFGNNDPWKIFLRGGAVDPDARFVDVNDTMTIGGGVRYKPGLIGWSLEHYQDVKQVSGKLGYSFTGFRTIIQM